MSSKNWRETLRELIEEQLATDRGGGNTENFQSIQTLLVDWLRSPRGTTRQSVQSKLDLKPEQIAGLLSWDPRRNLSGWTRTWAKCAAGLVEAHPALAPLAEGLARDLDPHGPECLRLMAQAAAGCAVEAAERERQVERFRGQAAKSRLGKALRSDVLALEHFSAGLRERLAEFYGDIERFTMGQLRVLEASLRHPMLWVEGPAGTGKTIVAMEVAYRALESGASCAIAYRSGQFRSMLQRVLGDLHADLWLISHQELSAGWKAVLSGARRFHLLIIDDYSLFGAHVAGDARLLGNVADRVMLLAALEQCVDSMGVLRGRYRRREDVVRSMFEPVEREDAFGDPFTIDPDVGTDAPWKTSATIVRSNVVECPPGFARVELTQNVRNAHGIVAHGNWAAGNRWNAAVVEEGIVAEVECGWDGLEEVVTSNLQDLLHEYTAAQIRIVVDPYLISLGRPPVSDDPFFELGDSFGDLPSLVRAILRAAKPADKCLSEVGADALRQAVSKIPRQGVHVVWANGIDAGAVPVADVDPRALRRRAVSRTHGRLVRGIHAAEAFLPKFLADPVDSRNAILAYPTHLFVGLESDVVMYVRSGRDELDWWDRRDERQLDGLKRLREQHHALAISRARFHLVNVAVS